MYVRSKLCESIEEIKIAIKEYLETLTPEKCRNFIMHLKRVTNMIFKCFTKFKLLNLFTFKGNGGCDRKRGRMVKYVK